MDLSLRVAAACELLSLVAVLLSLCAAQPTYADSAALQTDSSGPVPSSAQSCVPGTLHSTQPQQPAAPRTADSLADDGARCFACSHGIPGIPGTHGLHGAAGEKGAKGDSGAVGDRGRKGDRGVPGEPGRPGPSGPPGDCSRCPTGLQGDVARVALAVGGSRTASGQSPAAASQATSSPRHSRHAAQRASFSVARSARLGPVSVETRVTFDRTHSNSGNCFNMETSEFKAKVNGTYVFFVHVMSLPDADAYAWVMHNEHHQLPVFGDSKTGYGSGSNSVIVELAEGDRVWVKLSKGSGLLNDYTTFSGYLLYDG